MEENGLDALETLMLKALMLYPVQNKEELLHLQRMGQWAMPTINMPPKNEYERIAQAIYRGLEDPNKYSDLLQAAGYLKAIDMLREHRLAVVRGKIDSAVLPQIDDMLGAMTDEMLEIVMLSYEDAGRFADVVKIAEKYDDKEIATAYRIVSELKDEFCPN